MTTHIKRLKHQEDTRGPVTIPTDKRAGKDVLKVGKENNCIAFGNTGSYSSQRRKHSGRKLCNNVITQAAVQILTRGKLYIQKSRKLFTRTQEVRYFTNRRAREYRPCTSHKTSKPPFLFPSLYQTLFLAREKLVI